MVLVSDDTQQLGLSGRLRSLWPWPERHLAQNDRNEEQVSLLLMGLFYLYLIYYLIYIFFFKLLQCLLSCDKWKQFNSQWKCKCWCALLLVWTGHSTHSKSLRRSESRIKLQQTLQKDSKCEKADIMWWGTMTGDWFKGLIAFLGTCTKWIWRGWRGDSTVQREAQRSASEHSVHWIFKKENLTRSTDVLIELNIFFYVRMNSLANSRRKLPPPKRRRRGSRIMPINTSMWVCIAEGQRTNKSQAGESEAHN